MPSTEWINPSDCVDMDCDARHKVLITDADGTFLGKNETIISFSEYQWDGARVYGLGVCKITFNQLNILALKSAFRVVKIL